MAPFIKYDFRYAIKGFYRDIIFEFPFYKTYKHLRRESNARDR